MLTSIRYRALHASLREEMVVIARFQFRQRGQDRGDVGCQLHHHCRVPRLGGGEGGDTDNDSGIPFLKDIPGLGYLFNNKSRTLDRTEIIVLITPYIIDSPETASEAAGKPRRQTCPPPMADAQQAALTCLHASSESA